MYGVVV